MDVLTVDQTRARTLRRIELSAWTVADNGVATPTTLFSETLAGALQGLACEGAYGNTYLILERDTISGKQTLHAAVIRRGKWLGRYSDDLRRKVYPYHADILLSVQVRGFDPVEPWRWTPGCDPVGRDPNLLEGRAA